MVLLTIRQATFSNDHDSSKQHLTAMALFKKDQAGNKSLATGSPIAWCLMNIDEKTRKRMNKMFDLCYVMAREGLPFTKYPPLLELENRQMCQLSLTHYIAESQRQSFLSYMSNHLHFYGFSIKCPPKILFSALWQT